MRLADYVDVFMDEMDSYIVNNRYKFKKVDPKGVEDDRYAESLLIVLKAIDRINTIKDKTQFALDGAQLNEITVPKAFEKLILPRAIYVDTTDEMCKDLLVREDPKTVDCIDWEAFRTACKNVVAHFRNGKVWTYVPLNQLKKVVSLNDVLGSSCVDGAIFLNGKFNWLPIPILSEMAKLYDDERWNGDYKAYMQRYIKEVVIPYWRGEDQQETE